MAAVLERLAFGECGVYFGLVTVGRSLLKDEILDRVLEFMRDDAPRAAAMYNVVGVLRMQPFVRNGMNVGPVVADRLAVASTVIGRTTSRTRRGEDRRGLLRTSISSDAATALANRAVLLVDDMDVMRLEPFQSYGDSDKGQRAGRQSSLVNCWAGEDITIDEGAWVWSTRSVLVIGAGQFDGLEEPLDGSSLIRWGIMPPLAERIAMGTIVHMPPLASADLCAVALREALQLCAPAFSAFGYTLIISPEAVRRAVSVVRDRDRAAGVRAVTGLLRRVADRMLTRAVSEAVPVGTRVTFAPDDIER